MLPNTIRTAVIPLSDINALAPRWQSLFVATNASFFLSWNWIGAWLANIMPLSYKTFLVEAICNEKTVGMAIFCEKHAQRHKLLKSTQWHLHKTGDQAIDQIWMEYNDFLVLEDGSSAIRQSMWSAILDYANDVDEFAIGLSTKSVINLHEKYLSTLSQWTQVEDVALGVNIREGFNRYWSTRSRNFRSQTNRSDRILTESGFKFEATIGNKVFKTTFDRIGPLHIHQWREQSGFQNPFFVDFFKQLAYSAQPGSLFSCQLVNAKQEIAAALVGFIHNQTLYFYLSGQETFTNNKVKPGMTLHKNILLWCDANNIRYYDLMAGDYRYKRSFATNSDSMQVIYFQRRKLAFTLEHYAKSLKHWLFSTAGS